MEQPSVSSNLEYLRSRIDKMSKVQHIDILRILKQDPNIKINENKSGVYINLSFLPQSIVDEIVQYVQHMDTQENSLHPVEQQKEMFKNSFFAENDVNNKCNKDEALYYNNHQSTR